MTIMPSASTPQLYVGTSGFSFDDWKGTVYPEKLPRAQWLIYYEQRLGFNALEINYTYYQMPAPRTIVGLLRKTTDAFRFTIKTHRSMTHEILQKGRIVDNPKAFDEFREGMRPLTESGRLGAVLAQFPVSFPNQPECRDYLLTMIERLRDLQLVIEFRNKSWVQPETFELLRSHGVGHCAVDEPDLPRLVPWVGEATSDLAYARFHGRNAEKWFSGSAEERYDYNYSEQELHDLVDRVQAFPGPVKMLYNFFNNCHAGSAAKNARRFKDLLISKGLLPAELELF